MDRLDREQERCAVPLIQPLFSMLISLMATGRARIA
jgi:hypothetical protein